MGDTINKYNLIVNNANITIPIDYKQLWLIEQFANVSFSPQMKKVYQLNHIVFTIEEQIEDGKIQSI